MRGPGDTIYQSSCEVSLGAGVGVDGEAVFESTPRVLEVGSAGASFSLSGRRRVDIQDNKGVRFFMLACLRVR